VSHIFIEEAVARVGAHNVSQLLSLILVGETLNLFWCAVIRVEHISRFAHSARVHALKLQPP
jgi:hypothetical protein